MMGEHTTRTGPRCEYPFTDNGCKFRCVGQADWLVVGADGRESRACDWHVVGFLQWEGTEPNKVWSLDACCQCEPCRRDGLHRSDCGVHDSEMPEPCDCGRG